MTVNNTGIGTLSPLTASLDGAHFFFKFLTVYRYFGKFYTPNLIN